ncbi:MAG: alpha/beta hydrolase [Methanobacterium sp.]
MSKLSNGIEPSIKSFLEDSNSQSGPQIFDLSVKEAREVLLSVQDIDVNKLPADIEDRDIPGGPSGNVSIRIVRPKGVDELLPVIMYFHGGGWVLGDKNTHDRLIREIAKGSNAAVVFVNYTPSPEAKYPVPLEEAYAATKYIAENGNKFNLDSSKIVVAGDSVGGNMATVVSMMAKERGGPDILFQLLFYPVTDANFDTGSYKKFANDHWLSLDAMKWYWDNYLPDKEKRKEPTASPLQASVDRLKDLPPAMVINGEFDVLRDEGEAYAHKLNEAGVKVTAVRYLGTIHDFVMLNPITETPATRAAIKQASEMLRDIFKK